MTADRDLLNKLIERLRDKAREDADTMDPEDARTFAMLIIARELYDIEGSLDTLSITVEGMR